ncbi:MAG: SDR family NAD(P)-dependent oxidoreductase, partial [Bacilli bacterium]|nr:SDR family NAD(P)-dependent oxidoreductase [Bacilli bacterium]
MNKESLPFEIDLKDKVVVITGAAGVICGELASAFAACGAKVAVMDLNQAKADEKAEEIRKEGGIAKGYAANVLSKEDLEKAHELVLKDLGPCDILVNGAGGNSPKATTT